MAMLPRESDYPQYDPDQYYDSYVKFFMFGDSKAPIPKEIKIFNKVGLPLLAELGQALYDYELARNRMFTPDLGALVAGHRL